MKLKFLKTTKSSKRRLEEMRIAAFELNNLLTIPMKILGITEEKLPNSDWTNINLEVEDCADVKEFDLIVAAFLKGVVYRRKTERL